MSGNSKQGPITSPLAVEKFLSTGTSFPDGVKVHGRYHAPGSLNGWIVVETENILSLYKHAAEWGELLEWKTTQVLTNEQGGKVASKLFS